MSAAQGMQYVRLGKSGLRVSRLILGCMSYGDKKVGAEWMIEGDEAIKHMKAAYDLGINTFDTANVYSNGESERLVGRFIKEHKIPREDIVVLTKAYFPEIPAHYKKPAPGWTRQELDNERLTNRGGLSRKHLFEGVKASLERLQLDYVDVLQCHRFDYETPIEETMQALHDIVKAGYARYIGMSSCYAYQFHQMQNYAISHGLTPFISMQNFYNALYREEEREMLPTLEIFGTGCIPWSPLARGHLTRPLGGERTSRMQSDGNYKNFVESNANDGDTKIIQAVQSIAEARGAKMAQIATAWILSKKSVTAPIIGSTKIDSIKELVDAISIKLTEDEIKSIDEHYVNKAIKGHN